MATWKNRSAHCKRSMYTKQGKEVAATQPRKKTERLWKTVVCAIAEKDAWEIEQERKIETLREKEV